MLLLALVALMLIVASDNVNLVGLRPEMHLAKRVIVAVVLEITGADVTFTAGVEPRGTRSLHPYGLAVDFTFPGMRDDAVRGTVLRQIELLLPPGYDIVDEVARPSAHATGPHIHIEHDPDHTKERAR